MCDRPRADARLLAALLPALLLIAAAPLAAQTPGDAQTAATGATQEPTRWLVSATAGVAFATERDFVAPTVGGRIAWWFDDLHALVLDGRIARGGADDVRPGCITDECRAAFGQPRRLVTWFAGIESHISRFGSAQPVTLRLVAGVGQAELLTPARTSGEGRADTELAITVGMVLETPIRHRMVARFETDASLAHEPGYFVALPGTKEVFAFRAGIGYAF